MVSYILQLFLCAVTVCVATYKYSNPVKFMETELNRLLQKAEGYNLT